MKERRINLLLAESLAAVAKKWEIPLAKESSLLPSVGGLVPAQIPVVCGIGPVARDLYTPQESVNRISLIQRTLLIAEFLAKDINSGKKS
jgi:D-alanine-D-alanine ligase